MQSNNPVFNRNEGFSKPGGYATFDTAPPTSGTLEEMYAQPSATPVRTGRMTYDDVVTKTGIMFAVLIVGAAVGWIYPGLTFVGLIVGLVLGLVNSFKREPSPALMLAYAGFEGLFVGGISGIFEEQWDGIVGQAVVSTLVLFAVALVAYRSGRIRVTPKFQRGMIIAISGYAVLLLVNLVSSLFGGPSIWSGENPALALAIGAFAIGLATLSLVLDFDFIERGVRNGLPEKYAWTAAFGLIVTLVWLYIELLRLHRHPAGRQLAAHPHAQRHRHPRSRVPIVVWLGSAERALRLLEDLLVHDRRGVAESQAVLTAQPAHAVFRAEE